MIADPQGGDVCSGTSRVATWDTYNWLDRQVVNCASSFDLHHCCHHHHLDHYQDNDDDCYLMMIASCHHYPGHCDLSHYHEIDNPRA